MAKGKQPNMKVNVTADNSDLSRKMKDSKAAVKDFEKVSGDALDSFASALGVNTGQVKKMANAIKGLGEKMQKSGSEGVKSFGQLLSSVSGFSAALAGVGIAGVVASFKALNEQAETFKGTLEGASLDLMTQSYIDTYRQVLNDFNRETAKTVAEAEQSWKIAWNTFTTNLSYVITSGSIKAGDSVLGGLLKILQGGDKEAAAAATQAATEAMRLTERMYNIQVQLNNKTVEWARMERQIAEYKRIAYDKSVDTATQQEALNKATQLIEQRYKEEARLKKQLADLQFQYNDLASSSLEDIQKANQLRVDEENTVARMNNALRELSERQATIALNAEKEAEARKQALEYAEAMAKSRAEFADWKREAGLIDPAQEMLRLFNGNVDLLNRKLIDAAELVKKGWEDAGEGIATVFSSQYGIMDASGKVVEILVTPILPDGSVLSPSELEDYIYGQLENARDILAADSLGIVIATDVSMDSGEILHQLQEVYYGLEESAENLNDAVQPAQEMSSIFQTAATVVAGMSDDIAAITGNMKSISTTTSTSVLATYDGPADIKSLLPKGAEALTKTGLAIPVTPELDMSGVVDITNELQSVMTSAFDAIGVSIGELIGDLATGGDAWGNFANTAIGAFGDMAISIGKMAISTGVATLGIKAALESLNGYVAIAAGTALVALGAAVKAGLSNIASGSYSSSANVATAGGYGSSSMLGADFETREMKVEVTGTIRASGNELLTVIENENTRKRHTT